jgi:UDP-glucuronate 4-epimerase
MDYIEALELSLGRRAKKELLPLQPGDVPDTFANIDDLVSNFNYKPTTTIKQGIRSFTSWYKNYYN